MDNKVLVTVYVPHLDSKYDMYIPVNKRIHVIIDLIKKSLFELSEGKFNINKKECFYVGNDLHDDVLGAKGAGLRTVYIETEQSGKYSELNITPDYIVPTHKAMMELLFSLSEAQK